MVIAYDRRPDAVVKADWKAPTSRSTLFAQPAKSPFAPKRWLALRSSELVSIRCSTVQSAAFCLHEGRDGCDVANRHWLSPSCS